MPCPVDKSRPIVLNDLLKIPILEDFREENDDNKDYYANSIDNDKLDYYIDRNTYQKGIRPVRRYYGIVAKNNIKLLFIFLIQKKLNMPLFWKKY